MIVGSVQVFGYCKFWIRVFYELVLKVDDGFDKSLLERDREKERKTTLQSSIKDTMVKGQLKYEKLVKQLKEVLDSYKEGLEYENGLVLAGAKHIVKI